MYPITTGRHHRELNWPESDVLAPEQVPSLIVVTDMVSVISLYSKLIEKKVQYNVFSVCVHLEFCMPKLCSLD